MFSGPSSRPSIVREWIIFAVSVGLGGHLVLAVVLHAPEQWPWQRAGFYGLAVGLSVYIVVQLARSLWWLAKGRSGQESPGSEESGGPPW